MRITTTIEKLVHGGMGLARTEEGILLVIDVAPGETIVAEPFEKKGGQVVARPVEIISPSPARRAPPCPMAGICGGCNWLHLAYKAQLSIKKGIFFECLERLGRISGLSRVEIIAAEEFAYRHRAQFKIDDKGNAGFFARGTNDIVCIARCPLLVEPLNGLLRDFAEHQVVLSLSGKNFKVIAGDEGKIASLPVIAGRTSKIVTITAGGKRFDVEGNGFFQSNRPLLERLGTWAAPFVNGGRCVDCYGGCGFFSVMLADRFDSGLLIEYSDLLVGAAGRNFERNGIRHFEAQKGLVENISSLVGTQPPDCCIIDPPRPGMTRRVRESIASLKPKTIIYISCNPATQARDVGYLVNKAGYVIKEAALFDLYPNTHHIETILILTAP